MHFNFRRLSLTGSVKSTKNLQLDLTNATGTSPPLHGGMIPFPSSPPQSPTLSSPPGTPSPPSSPRTAVETGTNKIKRTDNRLRRLSVILRRNSTKRTSADYSSATSCPIDLTEPARIVAVTPKIEKAVKPPTPCFVEVEDCRPAYNKSVCRQPRVEQVNQRLFVIEEQQHATDEMVKAQQALSLGTTSEETEEDEFEEDNNDSPNSVPLSDCQWVKSTISV